MYWRLKYDDILCLMGQHNGLDECVFAAFSVRSWNNGGPTVFFITGTDKGQLIPHEITAIEEVKAYIETIVRLEA